MKRPIESDYTSLTAYTRALEEYCDALAQPEEKYTYGTLFSTCNETLRAQGKAYPRTCKKCGLGPCVGKPKSDTTPPAAPVQEPVAWEQFYPDIGKPQIAFNAEVVGYVAPQRTWVGLTDGVMCDIAIEHGLMSIDWIDFARAIEQALKEKNT
jgi:hypothetical protein